MSFIYCQNCTASYEPELTACPDCGANSDNPDGHITFTDSARTEISRLGGITGDFLPVLHDSWVIPCEWGVVVYHNTTQTYFAHFAGSIVISVTIDDLYINITHSTGKQRLPLAANEQ